MDLYRNELVDVLNRMPSAQPLESVLDHSMPDLIICALGFEDRTAAVVTELAAAGRVGSARLVLLHYPTNVDANEVHAPAFAQVAHEMRSRHDIHYSRNDFEQRLRAELSGMPSGSRVIFDISTCSSYLFYPVMRVLGELDLDLTVTYCEADTYNPTPEEWASVAAGAAAERGRLFIHSFEDADFLSHGVDDVFPSNLFAERNPGNKPATLVMMPNFNVIRTGTIIQRDRELNKTGDEDIVWIIGVPPGEKNRWRADAMLKTNRPHTGAIPAERLRYASTFDYQETLRVLEEIWQSRRYSSHLSIGALGSKLQHIGVYFFIHLHPEIGLWLTEPRQFKASQYSHGVGSAWAIAFGYTVALRENLARYMKFNWQL